MNKRLILASASPRRRELLSQIGYEFEVRTSDAEEITTEKEPAFVVEELSKIKARAVWETLTEEEKQESLVIGADTVVSVKVEEKAIILGKPKDEEEAGKMLRMLSGRTHQVYTGVTLFSMEEGKEKTESFHEGTDVEFCELTDEEIWDYIRTKDPMDKAGSYGIQGAFAKHIKGINGDYFNVVGLPVSHLYHALESK